MADESNIIAEDWVYRSKWTFILVINERSFLWLEEKVERRKGSYGDQVQVY